MNWNHSGKFKLLGIKFDLFSENKTLVNFEEKIKKIQSLLNSWVYRDLTYMGKITVIKSLALPILIQSLTVLPNPPDDKIKEIQNIFFSFLWSGKPDKIKRKVMIGLFENGGLKMPDIRSFCYSLKMTWINKLLDPLNISPWKTLLIDQYNRLGADKIWLMTPDGIQKISSNFNNFWKDILLNWNILNTVTNGTAEGIMKQSIWLNKSLKINNKTVFYQRWVESGVFFIGDLLDENSNFFTLKEFCEKYNLNINFLEYHSLLHMIPKDWKNLITTSEKITHISNDKFEFIKNNKKSCQFFYKKFLSMYTERPTKQEDKMCKELGTHIENWDFIYSLPFCCTKNNKFSMFQFKILHRTLATNALLQKYGLKETNLCSFCNETKETISHLFWECMLVRNLWLEIAALFLVENNLTLILNVENIVLVKKSDGSWRFCIDFRAVNLLVLRPSYPLPRIDD